MTGAVDPREPITGKHERPEYRRRASDVPWPDKAGRAVARFFSAISTKEGLGAAFALTLLLFFFWSRHEDRKDSKAEREALANERARNMEVQQKAMEGIAAALNKQADVMADQRATLAEIRVLMQVAVQQDPRAPAGIEPEKPPRAIPVPPGPAAQPLPKRKR